jgi:hypothetical protein
MAYALYILILFASALSFVGGVHIGARALHVLNLIWVGCIARLSQCGGGPNQTIVVMWPHKNMFQGVRSVSNVSEKRKPI